MTCIVFLMLLFITTTQSFDRPACFSGTEECRQYEKNGGKIIDTYKNKHLLFIGDSLTRYQYLDLVYTLQYGFPQNSSADPCITYVLEDGKHEKWNSFFSISHDVIGPNEVADSCNCHDSSGGIRFDFWFDNRYYYDPINNIRVTFLTYFKQAQGRILPKDVNNKNVTSTFSTIPVLSMVEPMWKSNNVEDVLIKYVSLLEHRPDFVVVNFGHWHIQVNSSEVLGIVNAAGVATDHFIWKTTTFSREEKENERMIENENDSLFADPMLQEAVTIMNTSWTKDLHPSYWPNDRLHFKNPVYSALNDQLADIVNKLKEDGNVN